MINKGLTSTLFSLIAIIMMIAPAVAVTQIEGNTEAHILAVEGQYTNGSEIAISNVVDKLDIAPTYNEVGSDSNNDSALVRYNSGSNLDNYYFGDYVTYLGNNSYAVAPDYTDNPVTSNTIATAIQIPMNITTTELLETDFLRFTTSDNTQHYYLAFRDNSTNTVYKWSPQATTNNTYLFIPSLSIKSLLSSSSDSGVYLWIGSNQGSLDLVGEPVSIEFSLESYELEGADVISIEDTTLYFIAIAVADIILIITLAFTTEYLDIKVDRKRG